MDLHDAVEQRSSELSNRQSSSLQDKPVLHCKRARGIVGGCPILVLKASHPELIDFNIEHILDAFGGLSCSHWKVHS